MRLDAIEKFLLGLLSIAIALTLWVTAILFFSTLVPEISRFWVHLHGGIYKGGSYYGTGLVSAIIAGLLPLVFVPFSAIPIYFKLLSLPWRRRGVACVAVALVFFGTSKFHYRPLPMMSDAEMIEVFHRNRSNLEEVRRMIYQDDLKGGIRTESATPKLPNERLAEYRRLLSPIGSLSAGGREKPFQVFLDSAGFLDDVTTKGFYYSREEQTPLATSLDISCFEIKEALIGDRWCKAFLSLGDGWWLFRDER